MNTEQRTRVESLRKRLHPAASFHGAGPDDLAALIAIVDQQEGDNDELRFALEESVKLQSHYARLINAHDGGKRMVFENATAWLYRLDSLTKAHRRALGSIKEMISGKEEAP